MMVRFLTVLLLVLPASLATEEADAATTTSAVAALPRDGDRAFVNVIGPTVNHCAQDDLEGDSGVLEWRTEEPVLFDGQAHPMMALHAAWMSDLCPAAQDNWEMWATQSSDLYDHLPGGATAQSLEYAGIGMEDYFFWIQDLLATVIHYPSDPCAGNPVALVAGLDADDAAAAMSHCAARSVLFPEPLATGWETSDEFGRHWTARFGHYANPEGAEEGILLRFHPELSVPLLHATRSHDGVERIAQLIGYEPGDSPFTPPETMPNVPTTGLEAWGLDGPSGSFARFPLDVARQAARTHPSSGTYFDDHPDARVMWFQYGGDGKHALLNRGWGQPTYAFEKAECTRDEQNDSGLWRSLWIGWSDGQDTLVADLTGTEASLALGQASLVSIYGFNYVERPTPVAAGPPTVAFDQADAIAVALGGEGRSIMDAALTDRLFVPRPHSQTFGPAPSWPTEESFVVTAGRYTCSMVGTDLEVRYRGAGFANGRLAVTWSWDSVVGSWQATQAGITGSEPAWSPPAFGEPSREFALAPYVVAPAALAGLALLAWAAKLGWGLFTRVHHGGALDHPTRARIMEAVQADAGLPLASLAARLDMHRDTAAHHARMLERLGHIRITRTWRGLLLHPAGEPTARHAAVMARAHAQALWDLLGRKPGIGATEAANRLRVPASRISEAVRALEQAGLVKRRRDGRTVALYRRDNT